MSTAVGVVECLLFSVISTSMNWVTNKSSLTEVRKAQIVTLHGEGYTERDTTDKLCCPKTAVHNAIVKFNVYGTFHDRKRSGR